MARISFVEFLCIVAIGVAMVEAPGHGFLRQPGASVVALGNAGVTAHVTTRDDAPRTQQPQEKNR